MIRRIKNASTATCTLPIYMGFLMTEPNSISCTQLAETYNISHDSVNRFLEREDYTPHDLYQEAIQHIDNNKLIVSIDDTVLDKPSLYTTNFTEPLSYQGSAFLKLPKFP